MRTNLRIVLLRLYELMVEIHVVGLSAHELASVHEGLHQQAVQFRGCVEVIAPSRVRAACAKGGMKREMGHQVARHVLHTVTTTEVNT